MGFLPDLQRIVNLLPKQRQSLLFSATFSPEIRKLAKTFLNDSPVVIEVAARNATAENVSQVIYEVDRVDAKRAAVAQIIKSQGLRQVIVFTNTKIGASRLARELVKEGIPADAIHGDKSQGERLATLEKFKKGEVEVMVATDVAARGLDIAELPAVINFDLPYSPEDYVHRIGRTGRAGASGKAMSLMVPEDARLLTDIEKLVKKTIVRERLEVQGRRSESRPEGRGERGERGERSERNARPIREERESRVQIPAARRPRLPDDPIFSQPYEPKGSDAVSGTAPETSTAAPANQAGASTSSAKSIIPGIRRAPRAVPSLLGGKKK
jgi:ATP-dependent RNA helicase RhlE